MKHNDTEIVSTILSHLLETIGPDKGRLFRSLAICRWKENLLEVAAGSSFTLDRLRNRFATELRVAIEKVFPGGNVAFVVDESVTTLLAQVASAPLAPNTNVPASGTCKIHQPHATNNPAAATTTQPAEATHWRPAKRTYHSFPEFIVGAGNKVAHAAAASILSPGSPSSLVLHGPSGSGKTHLLESIWMQAKQHPGVKRMVHLSAEQFLNQFVEALQGSGLPNFRRKYRDLQVLLIDDLHHLAGKRNTIVELQHTMDELTSHGQRVIFTCDRSPREISGLGEELIGRLSSGLILGMESPDEGTREGILRQLIQRKDIELPSHMLQWLAADLPGDARVLSGAVNRIHAAALAWGNSPPEDVVRSLLADLWQSAGRGIRLEQIAAAICDEFDLDPATLHSDARSKAISQPRMLAMYLARRFTRAPLGEISRFFGRKSHSTVLSAESKVASMLQDKSEVIGPHGKLTIDDALRRVRVRLRQG